MKVLNIRKEGVREGAVYIGRGSQWGNPFVIGRDGTREEVIEKYSTWIRAGSFLLERLSVLKGKDLVCFCAPLPCHGDVLKELLDERGSN